MRFLPLVVAVVLVFGGAGVYAGYRVIDPLGWGRWARCLSWCLLLLPATLPLWLVTDQLGGGRWFDAPLTASYLVLGLVSFLFVFALFRDCV